MRRLEGGESGDGRREAEGGGGWFAVIIGTYVEHLLGDIDLAVIRPMRLEGNAGNGVAEPVVDALLMQEKTAEVLLVLKP